jgi:bifunctional DNA-binding transcriptional regulator/antitoxin component of YhaV-PrlF toxin-antitoxin module
MTAVATVVEDGLLSLPQSIVEHFALRKGDSLVFVEQGDGYILRAQPNQRIKTDAKEKTPADKEMVRQQIKAFYDGMTDEDRAFFTQAEGAATREVWEVLKDDSW